MDILQYRITLYSHIAPRVEHYVHRLTHAHKNIYELKAIVSENIKTINHSLNGLKGSKFNTLVNIFSTVSLCNNMRDALGKIFDEINTDMRTPTEMSNTYLLNLESELQAINIEYEILKTDDAKLSSDLLHQALLQISDTPVNKLVPVAEKYTNAVRLYAHYLQFKLDALDLGSPESNAILELIENAKYRVFENTHSDNVMQRFGLVPIWQSLNETQVYQMALKIIHTSTAIQTPNVIHGGYSPDKLTKLSDMFREKKMGVLVMVEISPTQLVYDIKSLVDKETVRANVIPRTAGITNAVIDKYNVIKDVTEYKGTHLQNIKLGDTTSNQWFILRTINGSLYDIMGLGKSTIMNKHVIDKLYRGASSLISHYQKISSETIHSFLKTPRPALVVESTPLKNISNIISHNIIKIMDMRLKTIPKTLSDIYDIAAGDEIQNATSAVLIQSFEELEIDDSTEISVTFLANADYIIKGFVKTIKESLAKYNFTELMFKEKTEHALIAYIRTGLYSIIKLSSEKVFDPQSDIYEKIALKRTIIDTILMRHE
jgi:hypothetical protein